MAQDANTPVPSGNLTVIQQQVIVPSMLEKLASVYNITPQSPADIDAMIELGVLLRTSVDSAVKQASAGGGEVNPFLANALTSARQVLGVPPQPDVDQNELRKAAMAIVESDPNIAGAAVGHLQDLYQMEQTAAAGS